MENDKRKHNRKIIIIVGIVIILLIALGVALLLLVNDNFKNRESTGDNNGKDENDLYEIFIPGNLTELPEEYKIADADCLAGIEESEIALCVSSLKYGDIEDVISNDNMYQTRRGVLKGNVYQEEFEDRRGYSGLSQYYRYLWDTAEQVVFNDAGWAENEEEAIRSAMSAENVNYDVLTGPDKIDYYEYSAIIHNEMGLAEVDQENEFLLINGKKYSYKEYQDIVGDVEVTITNYYILHMEKLYVNNPIRVIVFRKADGEYKAKIIENGLDIVHEMPACIELDKSGYSIDDISRNINAHENVYVIDRYPAGDLTMIREMEESKTVEVFDCRAGNVLAVDYEEAYLIPGYLLKGKIGSHEVDLFVPSVEIE